MALPIFLIVFILLPSIQVLSSTNENQAIHPMILQTCNKIENQTSCHSKIQTMLESTNNNRDPNSILKAALENTLTEARQAIAMVTKFNSLSVSLREQVAIQDCKELLDFSVSELALSLAEMNKVRTIGSKDPQSQGNLKAWLSAALSNQDTCLEGFEGTDRHVERFIRGSLAQVTQLIGNVLMLYSQLHTLPFKPQRNSTRPGEGLDFPEWMTEGDKDLLVSSQNGMHVDAIVALDGTGHYRSITQAVFEAPSYSNRRYVIYIKKGVYKENIDMKKKKSYIMFVGDGIGETVVTGNRNFMQGWTTFRTATVGKYLIIIWSTSSLYTFFFF